MNPLETEKLRKGLLEDLSYARETAGKTQEASKAPEQSSFAPRALRAQNKVIGEAEIKRLEKAINKASGDLVYESGMVDELEQSKFKSDFAKRMNQVKLQFLKAAGTMQVEMTKRKMDSAKQQALWSALGSAARGVSESVVTNVGGGPSKGAGIDVNVGSLNSTHSVGGLPRKPGGGVDFGGEFS